VAHHGFDVEINVVRDGTQTTWCVKGEGVFLVCQTTMGEGVSCKNIIIKSKKIHTWSFLAVFRLKPW